MIGEDPHKSPEQVAASTSVADSIKRKRKKTVPNKGFVRVKPNNVAQNDTELGSKLWKVHTIVPTKPPGDKNAWLTEVFPDELVKSGHCHEITNEMLLLVLPGLNDRAHDYRKGMCIYWRMPACGFQLPLSRFQQSVLT